MLLLIALPGAATALPPAHTPGWAGPDRVWRYDSPGSNAATTAPIVPRLGSEALR